MITERLRLYSVVEGRPIFLPLARLRLAMPGQCACGKHKARRCRRLFVFEVVEREESKP